MLKCIVFLNLMRYSLKILGKILPVLSYVAPNHGLESRPMPLQNEISRRLFLSGLAALPASNARSATPHLGALAAEKGILFGSSGSWELRKDAAYAALFRQQSRVLTTGHALKFDYIRHREGQFDFSLADDMLDFANSAGMKMRGHTLFWNDNPPAWLKGQSKAELIRIFDEHIEVVGERFVGKLESWDVVNEPFWPGYGEPDGYRLGPWYSAMGKDYVARAFRRLGAIDRTTIFVLNEAQTERNDALGLTIRTGMLTMIDDLLDQGVRLDAIGLQAHLQPKYPFAIEPFLRFMDEIASRGLSIYLTEFDVEDSVFPKEIVRRDAKVAQWTRDFLKPVLQNKAVKALICWGLSDQYTWYRDEETVRMMKLIAPSRALPFDDQMRPKPMVQAIVEALAAAPRR
jgi:endo-1,4-beta-xylanase